MGCNKKEKTATDNQWAGQALKKDCNKEKTEFGNEWLSTNKTEECTKTVKSNIES